MRVPSAKLVNGRAASGVYSSSHMSASEEEYAAKKCYDPDEDDDLDEYDYPIPRHPTPPDGGRSWLVAAAAFFCILAVEGCFFLVSFAQFDLQIDFEATWSQIHWILHIQAGLAYLLCPCASIMCYRFGWRKVTITGSALAMFGIVLSVSATSTKMMIATLAVMGSTGLSMIIVPSILSVAHWFEKKRAFAFGVVFTSAFVAEFIFDRIMMKVLELYTWHFLFFMMAGVILNCAVAGMFFIPIESWRQTNTHRRPINSKVEIMRGEIMKALIENKKRERTTSHGSLDNCIITRENKLIKLDPKLHENKRNNSFIARFRRQLGFSSQSLASSKTSVTQASIPSIVIDAVNRDLKAKRYAVQGRANSLKDSPVYRPSGETQQQQTNGGSIINKGDGVSLPTPPVLNGNIQSQAKTSDVSPSKSSLKCKVYSVDRIPERNCSSAALSLMGEDTQVTGVALSKGSSEGMHQTRSASDLQSYAILQPLLASDLEGGDLRIQSIQLIPNENSRELAASKAKGARCRSSRSESSTYSFGGFSYTQPCSSTSSLPGSKACLSQMTASMEEELELSISGRQSSLLTKMWNAVNSLLHVKLLLDLKCFLFLLNTCIFYIATLLPFNHFMYKSEAIGVPLPDQAMYMTIVSVCTCVGQLLNGWLADRPWLSTLSVYCFSQLLSVVGIIMAAFCTTPFPLAIMCALYGFGRATNFGLKPVMMIEYVGLKKLGECVGVFFFFYGGLLLISQILTEKLIEMKIATDDVFFISGSLALLSILVMVPVKLKELRASNLRDKLQMCYMEEGCGGQIIQETLTMERLRGTSESSTRSKGYN